MQVGAAYAVFAGHKRMQAAPMTISTRHFRIRLNCIDMGYSISADFKGRSL